jgi:hypothetical protein
VGGLGVAGEGYDRRVHALPIISNGWPAIKRGLPQSAIELELAMPGGATLPFIGYQLRSLLAPVTQRGVPLPASARAGLGVAAAAIAGYFLMRRLARGSRSDRQLAASATLS